MANVSHVSGAKSGRKSAAAKPIPSKVLTPEDKQTVDELKLQGQPADVQVQADTPAPDLPPEVMEQERREREERRAIKPDQAIDYIAHNLISPVVNEGADPMHRTSEQLAAEFKQKMDQAAANLAKEMGIEDPGTLEQLLKGEAPQPPKMQKLTRNSITRPGSGTLTGKVWDVADEISAKHPGQTAATIAEIKAHPSIRGMNDHTIKTQYARWRQYHGVKGRVTAPLQAQQTIAPFVPHWGMIAEADRF